MQKPDKRPDNPMFSSGPCRKPPSWSLDRLRDAPLGRSHRSKISRAKLKRAIDLTREVLDIPASHRIAIVPGSDTGAVEMAMWTLLGQRRVHVLAWDAFGIEWVTDTLLQLKLLDASTTIAPYGQLPDFARVNFDDDVVFTWNGTAAGVRMVSADVIPRDRKGLTICDATSAAFAMPLDFHKLDVVTFSWQKVMGGEGAHGMLVLGPRAVQRLQTYSPSWPIPKLFRLAQEGHIDESLFEGATINTPSMLCVEDYIFCLEWAKSIGGAEALYQRAASNTKVLHAWVAKTPWIGHLATDPSTRSVTGVCLSIVDPTFTRLSGWEQSEFVIQMVGLLETEQAAYDIGAYRDAPAGLRIWCGATVEASDVDVLTKWLDWAFFTMTERHWVSPGETLPLAGAITEMN